MKILALRLLLFLAWPTVVFSQTDPADAGLVYDDYVYLDPIRSVVCTPVGQPLLRPMVKLRGGAVGLQFDWLGDGPSQFLYTLVHCDADWKPTNLEPNEYLEGFFEDRVRDYQTSRGTLQTYFQYNLRLPNADVKWSLSGNYLLKIYENEDTKRLALTRRIVVYEDSWSVGIEAKVPFNASKIRSHQELNLVVNQGQEFLANPRRDVRLWIFQNNRTDNPLGPSSPYVQHENRLPFDFVDSLVFPAGKEFRHVDLRSLKYKTDRVARISETPRWYDVVLKYDKKRVSGPSLYEKDADGGFVLDNFDRQNSFSNDEALKKFNLTDLLGEGLATNQVATDPRILMESDYSLVHFSLLDPSPDDLDGRAVYLFGGLTDWQIQPQFQLKYDASLGAWTGEAYLKQGYYNYEYAVFDPKTKKIDLSELNGDWYQTENRYTAVVYFKPFGSRYERAMAVTNLNLKP